MTECMNNVICDIYYIIDRTQSDDTEFILQPLHCFDADKIKGGEVVDEFNYRVTSSSIAGQFTQGLMLSYYQTTAVPAGWLVPLAYVRDMAHVRLIVPSKMGHNTAMQSVYPYYYDIRKYQIYR